MANMTYTARRGVVTNPGGGECLGCWMVDDTAETIGVDESTQLLSGNDVNFATGLGSWAGNNATLSNPSANMRVTNTGGVSYGRAYRTITCVVGETYLFTIGFTYGGVAGGYVVASTDTTTTNAVASSSVLSANGTLSVNFRATATTMYLLCLTQSVTVGVYNDWDNVTIARSGDLVGNGGFGQDVGWTLGTGWTISGGVATGAAGSVSSIYQDAGLVIGKYYTITYTISGYSAGNLLVYAGNTSFGTSRSANGTYSETVICGGNSYFYIQKSATFVGSVDNVSVRLAVPDVTGNLVGARVIGQLTKAAVATGSEPVYYSGFSYSGIGEHLEIPYQSAFDFGTGDFSFAVWGRFPATTAQESVFRLGYHTGSSWSGAAIDIHVTVTTSYLTLRITDDGYTSADTAAGFVAIDDGGDHFVVGVRDGSSLLLYVDGVLHATGAVSAAAGSLTNSSATLFIGLSQNVADRQPFSGSINSFRVFDYALTAAQVKTIYNSEKHLFERYSVLHMDGEEYSLDLDLSAATESHGSLKEIQRPISGAAETLLFNDWREFDCQTTLENRADAAPIKEALVNVMDGQTFTLDPYGTAASPDTPLEVQLDNESVTESREGTTEYVSYGFSVREVT